MENNFQTQEQPNQEINQAESAIQQPVKELDPGMNYVEIKAVTWSKDSH